MIQIIRAQKQLGKFEDAAKTIEEKVIIWPNDPQKWWKAAQDFASLYQQASDRTVLLRIISFVDTGLSKGMLKAPDLETNASFQNLFADAEFRKVVQKYQK